MTIGFKQSIAADEPLRRRRLRQDPDVHALGHDAVEPGARALPPGRCTATGREAHTWARGSACYRGAMGDELLWERVVGGHFVLAKRSFWPNFFSQVVARLQWNPMAIDLTVGRPRMG